MPRGTPAAKLAISVDRDVHVDASVVALAIERGFDVVSDDVEDIRQLVAAARARTAIFDV